MTEACCMKKDGHNDSVEEENRRGLAFTVTKMAGIDDLKGENFRSYYQDRRPSSLSTVAACTHTSN